MVPTGVIFDFDGVVADTQIIHTNAEVALLNQSFGLSMDPLEMKRKYSGVSDEVMFKEILECHQLNVDDIDNLINEKWKIFNHIIDVDGIRAIPGTIELIKVLFDLGYKLAIASGSPNWFLSRATSELGIGSFFTAIISSDEVKNGKPDPDIFLETSIRLSIEPKRCIVIEDGISGMIGASKAGMKCIGFVSDEEPGSQVVYPANFLVTSIQQINADLIQDLLNES